MDFEICTPAKFYLFFAFLSFLTALFYGQSFLFMIAQVIISALWVLGLNVLCQSGYKEIAWAITLVPVWIGIILYGLTFIYIGTASDAAVNAVAQTQYTPKPGDFNQLKSGTATQIINAIFRTFTNQAQFKIKPVS